MIPPKTIRKKILEALEMASGYGKTEAMVKDVVNALTGGDVALQELRDGIDRLHVDAMVRSEKDEDSQVLWFLTPKGKAKLNQDRT